VTVGANWAPRWTRLLRRRNAPAAEDACERLTAFDRRRLVTRFVDRTLVSHDGMVATSPEPVKDRD
jgi:hypothetical protein